MMLDMDNTGFLIVALLLGLLVGAGAAWLVARASARADAERARAETSAVRTELADARAANSEARAEAAQARTEVAQARSEVSDAHAASAMSLAELSAVKAQVTAANAQRDAAVQRAEELASDRDQLVKDFELLSNRALEAQGQRADASADHRLKATEQLMAPIRESLAAFHTRLNEVEKSRVEMSTDLAAQVRAVQATGEQLRKETHALSTALRKPQVRGAWGETQLKTVAEVAGMLEHCDFVQQATSTTSEDRTIRPDMRVSLSEGKFVYVDSKVPLTAFLDAQETEDDRDRERHLDQFARNVRGHVDALSAKNYWKAGDATPEFVVMFIPSEALGLEALRLLPDLNEYAAGRNVVVATPTTLIAMLRSVNYGWKQARLAESAAEVFRLGRELYDRLGTMGGSFDKVGRSLSSAVKAYNASVASLESRVLVTARRFRDLQVAEGELTGGTPVDEPLRSVSAPELVEDAARATPMIGRRPAAPLPEQEELVRAEPEIDELVESVTPLPRKGRMSG